MALKCSSEMCYFYGSEIDCAYACFCCRKVWMMLCVSLVFHLSEFIYFTFDLMFNELDTVIYTYTRICNYKTHFHFAKRSLLFDCNQNTTMISDHKETVFLVSWREKMKRTHTQLSTSVYQIENRRVNQKKPLYHTYTSQWIA